MKVRGVYETHPTGVAADLGIADPDDCDSTAVTFAHAAPTFDAAFAVTFEPAGRKTGMVSVSDKASKSTSRAIPIFTSASSMPTRFVMR